MKVLDFGIANRRRRREPAHRRDGLADVDGPEQSERNNVTPAADVWSLGLIAYNLLTDKLFWRASEDPNGTVHQVMKEVLFDPIPLASQRRGAGRAEAPAVVRRLVLALRRAAGRAPATRTNAAFAALGPRSAVVISLLPPTMGR